MAERKDKISSSLLEYLERRERNDKKILPAQRAVAENMETATQKQIESYERLANRIAESESVSKTLKDTAQTVSKFAGQEEAMTREVSHQMSLMFKEDRDLKVAYQKADEDTQAKMLKSIQDEALRRMNLSKAQQKEYEFAIKASHENTKKAVDEIIKKSEDMLFPIGVNLLRALDGFRHNIVEVFPKTLGRFFSDAMMEHYKTGLKEIGGIFSTHMNTILAPIDTLVGPFKAVAKSMFAIGKTLFSGPTRYEVETARVQREIRDNLKTQTKMLKDERKAEKDAASRAGVIKEEEGIFGKMLGWAKNVIMPVMTWIGGAVMKFAGLLKGPLGFMSKVFKRLMIPLMALWNFTKGLDGLAAKFQKEGFSAEYFADLGKLLFSSIMGALLELPEMIVNGILSMFNSEYRVDFSPEAISNAIDNLNTWLTDFTYPVFKFFLEDIPNFFTQAQETMMGWVDNTKNFISKVFEKTVEGILGIFAKLNPATIGQEVWNYVVDNLSGAIRSHSWVPDSFADTLEGLKVGGEDSGVTKAMSTPPSTTGTEKARADSIKEQVAVQKGVQDKLDQTNNNINENTKVQQQVVANTVNNQTIIEKEIPEGPGNLPLLLKNGSFG